MVKAWLRDDPETPEWGDRPTAYDPVHVVTDDTGEVPEGATETLVNPVLTVRMRWRTGYDDDGTPQFDWTTVVEDHAVVWSSRDEFDAEAGLALVKATAVLLYEGDVMVTETASVQDEDGTHWRVGAVRQTPGRLEMDLRRIDG